MDEHRASVSSAYTSLLDNAVSELCKFLRIHGYSTNKIYSLISRCLGELLWRVGANTQHFLGSVLNGGNQDFQQSVYRYLVGILRKISRDNYITRILTIT